MACIRIRGARMPVDMVAIPNATGAAIVPGRAASSVPAAASFANALAASSNTQPADTAADSSSVSDPASSGSAAGSSSPAGRSSSVSGVGNDSNTDDQTAPGASSSSINPGSIFSGGTVSAGRLISKPDAKTLDSRTGVNSAKTNAQARTAPSSSQSSPAAMSSWLAQQVAAAPQLTLNLASLGANIVLPIPPPIAAPAEIAATAPSILSTGAATAPDADLSATTDAGESIGPVATDLTPQTMSEVSPRLQQSAATVTAIATYGLSTGVPTELAKDSSAATSGAVSTDAAPTSAVASVAPSTVATPEVETASSATTSVAVSTDAATIGAVVSFVPPTAAMPVLEFASSATTTSAARSPGVTATFLTPPTSRAAIPPQETSQPQTIPPQIAPQPLNISLARITSPSTSSAILSTVLPISKGQVSAPPGSLNSDAAKMFAYETEAQSSLVPNLPVARNSARGSEQPVSLGADSGASRVAISGGQSSADFADAPLPTDLAAAAAITGEAASVANPDAANITDLPHTNLPGNDLPESGLPDGTPRAPIGSTSPASTQPILASAAASAAFAPVPAGIPTSVSATASAVAPPTDPPTTSKPAPFISAMADLAPTKSVDAHRDIAPITPRSVVPEKPGVVANSRAEETGRTIVPRDSDKSSSSIPTSRAVAPNPDSTDSAVPGLADVSANGLPAEPLGASAGSSGSAMATLVSEAQSSSTVASTIASAHDSKVSASPSTGSAGSSAVIPPSAPLPNGPKSSAAAASVASPQSPSLQSSPTSSIGPAPTRDAGSNTPFVAPSPSPSTAAPAASEKSGAPSGLPPAHQMLDSAPVPSTNDSAAGPASHLPSDPAALQMHLGVHTNAFGNVEIHTVIEQSQVGVAIHGDRDIARWFNSEVGGLETGLQGHHLNLTGVDFSSSRSGVQTATSFQQGQPRQNFSQNGGSHAAAPSAVERETKPVNEPDLSAALPLQGREARVSILA